MCTRERDIALGDQHLRHVPAMLAAFIYITLAIDFQSQVITRAIKQWWFQHCHITVTFQKCPRHSCVHHETSRDTLQGSDSNLRPSQGTNVHFGDVSTACKYFISQVVGNIWPDGATWERCTCSTHKSSINLFN